MKKPKLPRIGIRCALNSQKWQLILCLSISVFIYYATNIPFFKIYLEYVKPILDWGKSNWNITAAIVLISFVLWHILVVSRRKINRIEPPQEDKLNRRYFVDKLAEVINKHNENPENLLARIAITGDWGVGKTHVLESLASKLYYGSEGNALNQWRVAWIRPWQSENKQQALQEFADSISSALGIKPLLARNFANSPLFKWVASLVPKLALNKELIDFASGKFTCETLPDIAKKINKAIKRNLGKKIKLLVLIDDLERADPEIIKNWLPIIARLDKIENCQFVFALDPERIAAAFGEKIHEAHTSKGFLDKVFDLIIPLPEPRQEDVAKMLVKMAKEANCNILRNFVESKLSQVISSNPRTALKFFNQAKTKEIMYLHDNISDDKASLLFMIHLIEVEFQGFLKAIELSDIINYMTNSIDAYSNDAYENNNSILPNLKQMLLEKNLITINKIEGKNNERLDKLLESLSIIIYNTHKDTTLDHLIKWATKLHTHLDLLPPQQIDTITKRWFECHGQIRIIDLIKDLKIHIYNPDIKKIAFQIIDNIIDNFIKFSYRRNDTFTDLNYLKNCFLDKTILNDEIIHVYITLDSKVYELEFKENENPNFHEITDFMKEIINILNEEQLKYLIDNIRSNSHYYSQKYWYGIDIDNSMNEQIHSPNQEKHISTMLIYLKDRYNKNKPVYDPKTLDVVKQP